MNGSHVRIEGLTEMTPDREKEIRDFVDPVSGRTRGYEGVVINMCRELLEEVQDLRLVIETEDKCCPLSPKLKAVRDRVYTGCT